MTTGHAWYHTVNTIDCAYNLIVVTDAFSLIANVAKFSLFILEGLRSPV
jgi:hypothetical protein